jgi:hypothetical protein
MEKKFSIKVAVETTTSKGAAAAAVTCQNPADEVVTKLTCQYPTFQLVLDVLRGHYDRFMAGENELNTASILGHDLDDFFSADLLNMSPTSTTAKRTTPGLVKAVIVGSCALSETCRTRLTTLNIGSKDVRIADVVEIMARICSLL